jgi:mannose-6-phosphate isomerase-like protein (cupin superfamily)
MPGTAHMSLLDALAMGPPPAGNLAIPVFTHGTLAAELYAPAERDQQRPHERDEIYVVARGSGKFFDGRVRHDVGVGTFLFVAAGEVHWFEDFTPDLAVWVFFYGPTGGERASDR